MPTQKTLLLKTLPLEVLMWMFYYTEKEILFRFGGSPILIDAETTSKHIVIQDNSIVNPYFNLADVIMDLISNQRIGLTPTTVTVGDDRGKKEWFAAYEHDSSNPHINVAEISKVYHDGDTPTEAVIRCYLNHKLGSYVTVTIDDEGNYFHVQR